jgi:hypothetical protein
MTSKNEVDTNNTVKPAVVQDTPKNVFALGYSEGYKTALRNSPMASLPEYACKPAYRSGYKAGYEAGVQFREKKNKQG